MPAIVDTGAEISIMSSSCAKRCHLTNAIDPKYAGKAVGVGSSEILGGIQDLDIRIGPISFQNKISVLHNSRCDLLIGLDILRRFKCELSFREKFLKLQVKRDIIRVPLLSNDAYDPLDEDKTYPESNYYDNEDYSSDMFDDDEDEEEFEEEEYEEDNSVPSGPTYERYNAEETSSSISSSHARVSMAGI